MGVLAAVGIEANHVLDLGLRGATDDQVYAHAVSGGLILLTADLGFGNVLRFPVLDRPGIIIARFPNELPTSTLNAEIAKAIRDLTETELRGAVAIIEPGRVLVTPQGYRIAGLDAVGLASLLRALS